jgi:hypothetical protein
MAETKGLVQRLSILSKSAACVWIGPTPNNNTLLFVTNDGSSADSAFAASLVHALAAASTNYREVVAIHSNTGSKITALRVDLV